MTNFIGWSLVAGLVVFVLGLILTGVASVLDNSIIIIGY